MLTVKTATVQVKGEECQSLQGQCDELQHELDCLQAEHAKVDSMHTHDCLLFSVSLSLVLCTLLNQDGLDHVLHKRT